MFKFVIGPKTPSEKAAAAVATKEIKKVTLGDSSTHRWHYLRLFFR